jgi:hypothetical protein
MEHCDTQVISPLPRNQLPILPTPHLKLARPIPERYTAMLNAFIERCGRRQRRPARKDTLSSKPETVGGGGPFCVLAADLYAGSKEGPASRRRQKRSFFGFEYHIAFVGISPSRSKKAGKVCLPRITGLKMRCQDLFHCHTSHNFNNISLLFTPETFPARLIAANHPNCILR